MLLQPPPDARIALHVAQREPRVSLVPNLCRQLMPPLEILEEVLPPGSALQEKIRVRPAHSTAESHIQPPGDFVDEFVHVSLVPTIVIACEQHPPVVINKHPPRKEKNLHSRQITPGENVPRGELNHCQSHRDQPAAKCPRFG